MPSEPFENTVKNNSTLVSLNKNAFSHMRRGDFMDISFLKNLGKFSSYKKAFIFHPERLNNTQDCSCMFLASSCEKFLHLFVVSVGPLGSLTSFPQFGAKCQSRSLIFPFNYDKLQSVSQYSICNALGTLWNAPQNFKNDIPVIVWKLCERYWLNMSYFSRCKRVHLCHIFVYY